jgi:hypothetical protein
LFGPKRIVLGEGREILVQGSGVIDAGKGKRQPKGGVFTRERGGWVTRGNRLIWQSEGTLGKYGAPWIAAILQHYCNSPPSLAIHVYLYLSTLHNPLLTPYTTLFRPPPLTSHTCTRLEKVTLIHLF